MKSDNHISVKKDQAIECLNVKPNGIYVDCTFGRGGHSLEILKLLNNNGKLISIDKDIDAEKYYNEHFEKFANHKFVLDSFSNLERILIDNKIEKVDGFLFDFGLSSPQLDNSIRGFSYRLDGPLDMRMDQSQKLTASDVVNTYTKEQLNNIFKKYGEIKKPFYVTNAIVKYRENKKIETTLELVEIIKNSVSVKDLNQKKHFARLYFQAIRIEVNNELFQIEKALEAAFSYLNKNGRIVTISFHSLEEKEVKKGFLKTQNTIFPKELPINNLVNEYKVINVKNKWATENEICNNRRSRSSLIKVIERR